MSELMRLARATANGGQADARSAAVATLKAGGDSAPLADGACAACLHFTASTDKASDGCCGRYGVEAWGASVGGCRDGFVPSRRESRALEARRRKVGDVLRAHPALRYAYDVAGASPIGPAAAAVSVLLGLRNASGTIVTGELTVPASQWDMAAFIAYWEAKGRP